MVYSTIMSVENQPLTFDPFYGDYMGARLRRDGWFGFFYIDLGVRPDFGIPGPFTRWYSLQSPVLANASHFSVENVHATEKDAFVVLTQPATAQQGPETWIMRRKRGLLWNQEWFAEFGLPVASMGARYVDSTTDGDNLLVLSHADIPAFNGTFSVVTSITPEGVEAWTRVVVASIEVDLVSISAYDGSIYLTGAEHQGEQFRDPVIVRLLSENGSLAATRRFDGHLVPEFGRQPAVVRHDSTGRLQMATLDDQLNASLFALNPISCAPFGLAQTIPAEDIQSTNLRDLAINSAGRVHLLFGPNEEFEDTLPVQVTVTRASPLKGTTPVTISSYLLPADIAPLQSFLVSAGEAFAIGGAKRNDPFSPLVIHHSDGFGFDYPCAPESSVIVYESTVSSSTFDALSLTSSATLTQPFSVRSTAPFFQGTNFCE